MADRRRGFSVKNLLIGVLVIGLLFLVNPLLAAACSQYGDCPPPPPQHDGEGVGYYYDSVTQTFYPTASNTEGSEAEGGVRWMTRYVVLCGLNDADSPADDFCTEAACETADGFGYMSQVFRRLAAADPWEPWPGRERECRAFGDGEEPIALEDVEDEIVAIIEQHYEQIARPAITLTPADNALVNVPVLAETPDAGAVRFEVENPLPGYVEATPEYNWAWSNGASAAGAGRVYDGTDPIAEPGHYPVRATYASSGIERVSVSAAWQIVLTVDGIPPITDIAPLVYEAATDFPVRSARTVIVD